MKPILRACVERSGLTIEAVAEAIDVRSHYLKDATNPSEPQRFPVDLLVPFMLATKSIEPLRWLAQQAGCAVVALPTTTPGTDDIRDRFLVAVEELGQDSAVIQRALGDGEITPSEGRDIAAELRDTIDALLAVEAAVLARVERKAPAKMALPSAQSERRRA